MTNIFVGIRLPPEVIDALDAKASILGIERSQLIRDAIAAYLGISLDPTVARIEKLENEVVEMKELIQTLLPLLRQPSAQLEQKASKSRGSTSKKPP